MKLLIAYDGSDGAKAAIDDLRRAGLPDDVEARVLCVADVFPHLAAPGAASGDAAPVLREIAKQEAMTRIGARAAAVAKQAVADAAGVAEEGAARVRELFPTWRTDAHSVGDSPHWGVIKAAHAWNADLIVVGATGRSALQRLMLGSVSRTILTHATCSVRVGRRGEVSSGTHAFVPVAETSPASQTSAKPIRLVLGIDRSAGAATAVAAVAARRWPSETEVAIVTAIDLQLTTALPMILSPGEELPMEAGDEETLVTKSLHRVARELSEAGLRVTPVIARGSPKRVLLAEAEARHADCIFVGATGLTRAERLLIGSVSASVANHAHCSVEIVRG